MTREKAFVKQQPEEIYKKVDYWFDESGDILRGNYTLLFILEICQKHFKKPILLFGVDMTSSSPKEAKWYDRYDKYDLETRGINYPVDKKLMQCTRQITKFVNKENIWNCNMRSKLDYFDKKEWRDILDVH